MRDIILKLELLESELGVPAKEVEATVLQQSLPINGVHAADLRDEESRKRIAGTIAEVLGLPPRQVKILDINSAQQGGNKSTSEPPKDSTMLLEEGEIIDDVPKVNILYEVIIFDDDTRIDIESKMDGIGSDESVDHGSFDARDATQRIVGSVADEVGMEADSLSMEKPAERPAPTTRTEREQPASVDVNALQVELEEEKNDNERSHIQCVDSAQYR